MKLAIYMKDNRLTDAAFAASVGTTEFAVGKWRRGERIPRQASMLAILVATGGAVTANDFLTTPSAPRAEAQP